MSTTIAVSSVVRRVLDYRNYRLHPIDWIAFTVRCFWLIYLEKEKMENEETHEEYQRIIRDLSEETNQCSTPFGING